MAYPIPAHPNHQRSRSWLRSAIFRLVQITTWSDSPAEIRICLIGELDIAISDQLRAAGEQAVATGCRTVTLDLTRVTFADATGLGTLLAIRNASEQAGTTLYLLNPPVCVWRLLQITELTDTFSVRTAP